MRHAVALDDPGGDAEQDRIGQMLDAPMRRASARTVAIIVDASPMMSRVQPAIGERPTRCQSDSVRADSRGCVRSTLHLAATNAGQTTLASSLARCRP
jgi:hypothetical protein